MPVEEAKAFKASWPGTVHKNYPEARQANIEYLVKRVFVVSVDDDLTDGDTQGRSSAADTLLDMIKYDRHQRVKTYLEALIKEL